MAAAAGRTAMPGVPCHPAAAGAPPAAAPRPPSPATAAAQPLPQPTVDALSLLSPGPGRTGRPKRIAVLLRGLPGSGKSHVARLMREKEVAAGGEPPRILSLDDYFMTVS
jgi:YLP motif-containing protein 1